MLLAGFVLLWATALYATHIWAAREQRIPLMTSVATVAWWALAYAGGRVEIYHETGASSTVSVPTIQYVCLALGILSIGALILWITGNYPPRETEALNDIAARYIDDRR